MRSFLGGGALLLLTSAALAQPAPSSAPGSMTGAVTDHDYLLTIINERDHQYLQRFDALEKSMSAALIASREAISKAETSSEKRFDAVNEFRASLKDQQQTLMPRVEYNVQHDNLVRELKVIADRVDTIATRQYREAGAAEGTNWLWGMLIGGLGLIIAAGVLITNIMRFQHPKRSSEFE